MWLDLAGEMLTCLVLTLLPPLHLFVQPKEHLVMKGQLVWESLEASSFYEILVSLSVLLPQEIYQVAQLYLSSWEICHQIILNCFQEFCLQLVLVICPQKDLRSFSFYLCFSPHRFQVAKQFGQVKLQLLFRYGLTFLLQSQCPTGLRNSFS